MASQKIHGIAPKEMDPAISPVMDLMLSQEVMPGPIYLQVLGWVHEYGRPSNYLEIGVSSGNSFRLAKPETRAVGVDPNIEGGEKGIRRIIQCTSDEFFARDDVPEIMDGPIQLAFIDGAHYFDQVLIDFRNTEKLAAPGSMIVLHDVYPTRPQVATREPETKMWSGDVWKAVSILREVRPDLSMHFIPTAPCGLMFVTGLDPSSTVLTDRFDQLVEAWMPKEIPEKTSTHLMGMKALRNQEEPVRDFITSLWSTR